LDQIERLVDYVAPDAALFCFAYTTLSGCAEFQRRFGEAFWQRVNSKWLVGFDYGRTEPVALEFLSEKQNAEIRVYDGTTVVNAERFFPERDFHMKACFLSNEQAGKFGMLVGSGNFSRSGLVNNVECGVTVTAKSQDEYRKVMKLSFEGAHALWVISNPLEDVLAQYKALWKAAKLDVEGQEEREELEPDGYDCFWIDVGYVTRNRGPNKPGNQIDMPRGVHRFFGLTAAPNQTRNSVIGDITFVGSSSRLTRTLRLGNNYMEKITLPFPENYGFGAYDGKILEFKRVQGGFAIRAFEIEDYFRLLNRSSRNITQVMGSGRLYGYR